MQNPADSESCQTSTAEHFAKIVNDHIYFRSVSFLRSLPYELNLVNFFNIGLMFTSELSIVY